jgi:hypothetical protein
MEIVAPLLFHVARRRKGVAGRQAITSMRMKRKLLAFRPDPAEMAGFCVGLNRLFACTDQRIVQPSVRMIHGHI